ncbi:MAG TPA: signal peptidase I [Anaerolineae bacterium]|nr:signal peptidase I [Caldilineae bacterium]HID33397.1 signal peptidase I [Anaerolineae bacterium]HIQ12695.1 signal peptidase I [Caldilineales bacterium]
MSDLPDFEPQEAMTAPDSAIEEMPEPPSVRVVPAGHIPHPSAAQKESASVIWETLQTLVLAGLLIIFFRAFIFQNFVVEGSSMYPTLMQGDRLIVSRISYIFGEPDRGDIIVFQYPFGPERDFVKRIIGLPGETIAIQNGQVFIDGKPLPPETYVQNHSSEQYGPVTLGKDEFFVMGDNRTGSSDSRSWGPLQGHFIIGKAWLIYYPFNRFTFIHHPDLDIQP